MQQPVFRFAPSPNGALHLGHAYSALLNEAICRRANGRLLLRIEDIDIARCTPELEIAMLDDLKWIGFSWEEPPMRQSERFEVYQKALEKLAGFGLLFAAPMSRGQIRQFAEGFELENKRPWPRDPDGFWHYPASEREYVAAKDIERLLNSSTERMPLRLDLSRALVEIGNAHLTWVEGTADPKNDWPWEAGETIASDIEAWGDVLLSRRDTPASYHLSCVLDDAAQVVTHVVRGKDLYAATVVHRLLQTLLDLPEPSYHHHRLLLGDDGRKLSKSENHTGLSALRKQGWTRHEVLKSVGLQFLD